MSWGDPQKYQCIRSISHILETQGVQICAAASVNLVEIIPPPGKAGPHSHLRQHRHRNDVAGVFCNASISLHMLASNGVVMVSILTHYKQTSVGILCEKPFDLDTPSSEVLLLILEVLYLFFYIWS